MYILIAAATPFEIQPTIDWLNNNKLEQKGHQAEICITGVGMLAASYHLTQQLSLKKPHLVFQAGIAGGFRKDIPLGASLLIESEAAGDIGVEENNSFLDLFDLGFMETGKYPFSGRSLVNPFIKNWQKMNIMTGKGITVNEITTRPERIALLRQKYEADAESMEGAACHYACLQTQVPFLQIRSISNYVGERDKTKWNMKAAIQSLNETLINCIRQSVDDGL